MIKLEHISKTFGDTGDGVHAVKDVSLEIGDGEIFGIIGFSGAGKSTLVRCINLLERPTSGSITVNGRPLDDYFGLETLKLQRHRHSGRSGADGPLRKGAAAGPEKDQHDLSGLQPADAADLSEKCLLPHGAFRCTQGPG